MAITRGWKLSRRTVDRFSVEDRDAIFWDRDLPGFENFDLNFVSYVTLNY